MIASQDQLGAQAASSASATTLAREVDDAKREAVKLDDGARAIVERYTGALEKFHAEAWRAVVRGLRADARGKELLLELVDEPVVYAALLALGVVRPDVTTRVAQALEHVKPYARSHGGDVELVRVEEGVAYVRFHGACNGCSMSAQTLAEGVEKEVRARVPEILRVEQVKGQAVAGLVMLTVNASEAPSASKGWSRGPEATVVEEGRPTRMLTDGCDVVLVRQGERIYAYRNACPHQGMPLDEGVVNAQGVLTCPWHGLEFEVCTGECRNEASVQLDPLPLKVHEGVVWVRAVGATR
ncbi:MAG: NifU family protein [Planctomycetota bacterium]|nr:NifU family protein [Planctomycetota bacterium]